MSKKRIVIVFGVVVTIAIGFMIINDIHPILAYYTKTVVIDDVSEKQEMDLKASRNQEHIWHLTINIIGQVDGNAELKIGYNDSTHYRSYKIEKGNVDIEYDGDWYTKNCYVIYNPVDVKSGNLKISYHFTD